LNEENIWVNLNERRNDNQSEMLQTIKDLKEKLQSLKDYNECILKVKEELNDVLLNKLHDHEYFKNTKFGSNEIVNEPYKRKARKYKYSDTNTEATNENLDNKRKKKLNILVKGVIEINKKLKRNASIMMKSLGNLKRLNPLCLMVKLK
jgi:hypothetical protein